MLLINGNRLKVTYFSNTEARIKEFTDFIKPSGNYIELKYETENSTYKINDDLMQLYFIKQEFDSLGIEVSLVLWSMPYQRMDHKNVDDILTLPYVAKFLKDMNFKKILVIEPHSIKTQEYLGDVAKMVYPVADWVNLAVNEAREVTDNNKIVVIFPDGGAYERYKELLEDDINICVFEKKRNNVTNEIIKHDIIQGKIPEDSVCYVVDDICSSGQTLLDVAFLAKRFDALEVTTIVGHCEYESLKRNTLNTVNSIDKMYTSESMISTKHEKITYMSISEDQIKSWLEE